MSCKKAQKYFEQKKISFKSVSDARKEPISESAAWKLMSGLKTLYVGKGQKVIRIAPGDKNREAVLKITLGRTGNLRAPAMQAGDSLFVGYNDVIYDAL